MRIDVSDTFIKYGVMAVDASEFDRARTGSCLYCGTACGETRDHVVPVSWEGNGRRYELGTTVRCCRECNGALGARPLLSVESRAGFLANYYADKYAKAISMPDWDDAELEHLDDTLRSKIEAGMSNKMYHASRIQHCLSMCLFDSPYVEVKQVAHDDGIAYRILVAALGMAKTTGITKMVSTLTTMFDVSREYVHKLLDEKVQSGITIGFKMKRHLPLDAELKKILRALKE